MALEHSLDPDRDLLEGYFRDDEPGDVETPDDTTPIRDLTEANWHLRAIATARRKRAELQAVYTAEMHRLSDWWETQAYTLDATIARHEEPLRSYALMRRETDGTKTLDLPDGTVRTIKSRNPRVTVDDEAAVTAWAGDSLPDLLEPRPPRIVKAVLNAYVQASGEIPPGVTVTPPAVTVTITTGGDE